MPPIISVRGLSKRYKLGAFNARTLREEVEVFLARFTSKELKSGNAQLLKSPSPSTSADAGEFWALRDVSFDVQPGEVVGIIGGNGAGKSTLLKILSRITEPTGGEARIRGRVASLLEVGTGFHPELTGRENIFLNGAILGMTKAEIRAKFDEIVAFAEIEKFIDTPVKRYSSGMYVRLAFAVAAHLEPEILIIDEVLAVGDASFQKKCLGKMQEVSGRDGRTVLFVSHNMAAVENLCHRAVLLAAGQIRKADNVASVIASYLQTGDASSNSGELSDKQRPPAARHPGVILRAGIQASDGRTAPNIQIGAAARLFYDFDSSVSLRDAGFGFGIHDHFGTRVTSFNNYFAGAKFSGIRKGRAVWEIEECTLAPGNYSVTVSLYDANHDCIDYVENAFSFVVEAGDFYGSGKIPEPSQGVFVMKGTVRVEV